MNVNPSSQSLIEGITAGSVAEFFVPSVQLTQFLSLLMNPRMIVKKGRESGSVTFASINGSRVQ